MIKPQIEKKNREIGLGNFVILEILGQDDFSVVYKAFDKKTKEFVALKVFKETKTTEFRNEKEMLKVINKKGTTNIADDNILIKILENYATIGTTKSIIFLEAASADLSSVVSLRIKYKENEIFYILNDLMECLFLLNQKNICHGNIKLSNIVLFPRKMDNNLSDDLLRSNTFTYKLIDYSISHEYKQPLRGMTELYASPELKMVYKGSSADVDYFQSDMYAVGILCLKLMGLKNNFVEIVKNDLTKLEDYKDKYPNLINVIKELLENKAIPSKDLKSFRENILKNSKVRIEAPFEKLFVQSIQFQKIEKFDEELCKKYAKIHYNKKEFIIARKYLKLSQKGKFSEEEQEKFCEEYEKTADINDFDYDIQFENPPPLENDNGTVTAVKRYEIVEKEEPKSNVNKDEVEEDNEDARTIDFRNNPKKYELG